MSPGPVPSTWSLQHHCFYVLLCNINFFRIRQKKDGAFFPRIGRSLLHAGETISSVLRSRRLAEQTCFLQES